MFRVGPSAKEKELQDILIAMSSEKGAIEEQNRELTRRLVQAERNQQSTDRGDGRYVVQIEEQQREIDRLNQQLKSTLRQSEGKYNDLLKNYNHASQAIEGHKSEAERLRQENKTLTKLNEQIRDLGKAEIALNDSKRKITDLEGSARRLQQELNTSEDDNNWLKNEVASQKDALNSTRKQVSDQQKEIRDLQSENSSSKRESTEMQRKNDTLEASSRKQQKEITELTRDNSNLKTEVAELTLNKRKQADEISDLKSTVSKLKNDVSSLQDSLNGSKKQVTELREEAGGLKKDNERIQRQANDLQGKLKGDSSNTQDLASKKQVTELREEAAGLKKENERLQQQASDLQGQVTKLDRDLQDSNTKGLLLQADLRKEIQDLQRENSSSKQESTGLQQKNEALETSCTKHQRDIAELERKNNGLKTEIAELASTNRKQTEEISDLKATVSKLSGDVSTMQDSLNASKKLVTELQDEVGTLRKDNERIKQQTSDQARLTADHDFNKSEMLIKGTNLEGVATQIAEFSNMYATWERTLAEVDAAKDAAQSLLSIRTLHENLVAEYHKFKEHSLQAGHAMALLRKYEEQYQDQTERLHIFIEKKLIPESEDYSELLASTSDIAGYLFPNKIKCFISYAWEPIRNKNAVLQTRLVKIKEDLEKSGIHVMLDVHNMEGDINRYMIDGIQASDRILIICTPRFKQRSEETLQTPNNLQKELEAAVQKQSIDPKFIIPLILEGDRSTSVAKSIENILSLDFTERKRYCENMISLMPKGLIPMILGLERNRVYAQLLKGYQSLTGSKK